MTNLVALGADTLDGRATLRYDFPVSIRDFSSKVIWVDAATKLPVQVVFTGAWGGLSYRTIHGSYTAASRSPHRFLIALAALTVRRCRRPTPTLPAATPPS